MLMYILISYCTYFVRKTIVCAMDIIDLQMTVSIDWFDYHKWYIGFKYKVLVNFSLKSMLGFGYFLGIGLWLGNILKVQ